MKQTIIAVGLLALLGCFGRSVITADTMIPQAEAGWTRLQAVHPGATIECRPHEASKNLKGEIVGVSFRCVERVEEGRYNQFNLAIAAEVWPAEWPPAHCAFIRRHLYASRKDVLMRWLQTRRAVEEDTQKARELETRFEQLLSLSSEEIVYLCTKPTACDDDFAPAGAHGQIDPQLCDGILFPELNKQVKQ